MATTKIQQRFSVKGPAVYFRHLGVLDFSRTVLCVGHMRCELVKPRHGGRRS
jgi:hypothetical protein